MASHGFEQRIEMNNACRLQREVPLDLTIAETYMNGNNSVSGEASNVGHGIGGRSAAKSSGSHQS
jgi:hypothetical protein